MDTKTQTVSFDNKQGQGDNSEYSSLFSASSDLQDVQTAVVINYHIDPTKVVYIYRTYGTFEVYKLNIIEPMIRDTVKSVTAEFTANDLVQKRPEVAKRMGDLLTQRMSERSAIFERINIVNFEYSKEYSASIERKQVAEQDALTAKNKLEQVKFEASQRVAQAEGESKAIAIQVSAINQKGGQYYVQLEAIKKWNGITPIIVGGSTPFIDISSMVQSQSQSQVNINPTNSTQ